MGKLHYLEDDAYGCQEYDTEKVVLNRTDDLTPFMIAERGECSFVQKVRNMENIGVSVAIIVDSRAEMIDEILMSDDGTGGGIRIPSMLIGMRDESLARLVFPDREHAVMRKVCSHGHGPRSGSAHAAAVRDPEGVCGVGRRVVFWILGGQRGDFCSSQRATFRLPDRAN